MLSTGEEVEVRSYKRLTDLVIEDEAVKSLTNVQPGDCIVCFSKQGRDSPIVQHYSKIKNLFILLPVSAQCS
jgi:hypothetical protein